MMYCSNCGSEIESGSQFCNTCGKLVAANLKEIKLINIQTLIRIVTPISFALWFLYDACQGIFTREMGKAMFPTFSEYVAHALLFGALFLILAIIAAFLYNFIASKIGGVSIELSE